MTVMPSHAVFDTIDSVCEAAGVERAKIVNGLRRSEHHARRVRYVAMTAVRRQHGYSYPHIGRRFNVNHATVLLAHRTVDAVEAVAVFARAAHQAFVESTHATAITKELTS